MSDTPRTDTEEHRVNYIGEEGECDYMAVPSDLARQLERLVGRAYRIMEMAGYKVSAHDAGHNNPIIAWMADARVALYVSGQKPNMKCDIRDVPNASKEE